MLLLAFVLCVRFVCGSCSVLGKIACVPCRVEEVEDESSRRFRRGDRLSVRVPIVGVPVFSTLG